MKIVKNSKKGRYDESFLTMCRVVTNEDTAGTTGEWEPWRKAANEIGEENLREMVESGTMVTRLDPRLPPNSKIQWPNNQQVAHVREVWSNLAKQTESKKEVSTKPQDEEGTKKSKKNLKRQKKNKKKKFQWQSRPSGSQPSPQLQVVNEAKDKQLKDKLEKDKSVVAGIRRAHSAWDRQKRDWEALVEKSNQHPNTKGCKFESALSDLLAAGMTHDKVITAKESKHLRGEALSETDVAEALQECKLLHELMKNGSKKAQALRPWFNL